MDTFFAITLSIILLVFFSGMEAAFVTANKLKIELDRKQDVLGSGIIKYFASNSGQYLSTMVIGNIVAIVIYGLVSHDLINPMLENAFESDLMLLFANILISTVMLIIIADFLAKTFFIISPNFFLKLFSVPALIFFYIFFPVSKFFVKASNLILRFFVKTDSEQFEENEIFSQLDIDRFMNLTGQNEAEKTTIDDNYRILQNVLDFSRVKLWECMVPRTEIKAVDIDTSVAGLKSLFMETGHSRLLVYQDSIDNVVGYFDLKDIFKDPPDIKSYIRKVIVVPETMAANKLLKIFVEQKKNVALVVDEFGGTSGIITIEDVVEEIVGDIEDEHDFNELTEKAVSKNEFIFSGRLEIDYLNEKYNFGLPEEDDYKTLAGLIFFYHGSIPNQNDIIRIKNNVFRVLKVTTTRLELVNLRVDVV